MNQLFIIKVLGSTKKIWILISIYMKAFSILIVVTIFFILLHLLDANILDRYKFYIYIYDKVCLESISFSYSSNFIQNY